MTSIYEVSHEQIVCVRALSSNLEKLHKILELSMNIATNLKKNKSELEQI